MDRSNEEGGRREKREDERKRRDEGREGNDGGSQEKGGGTFSKFGDHICNKHILLINISSNAKKNRRIVLIPARPSTD